LPRNFTALRRQSGLRVGYSFEAGRHFIDVFILEVDGAATKIEETVQQQVSFLT
jgi:hypothetical protein